MTFDDLINRAARAGLVQGLRVSPRRGEPGRWEASVKSKDHDAYEVYVGESPIHAIAGLFLERNETVWFTASPDLEQRARDLI